MTLARSFPISEGYPLALDVRRVDAGLIAREGVFFDDIAGFSAGIAYGNGGWQVGARAFVAASKRGAAPYSLTYGVARVANASAGTAWEIGAAPASGSRIDLLWVRITDPDSGEATSGADGPGGVARAVPEFGVTAGVAATTPVAPALPAGALLIATVTTPSGAASIAGSTIEHTYAFAQIIGAPIVVHTAAEVSALVAPNGERAYAIDTGQTWQRIGGTWYAPGPFRWSNDTARINQTGMRDGDVGYIVADRSEWVYTGSAWRAAPGSFAYLQGAPSAATGATTNVPATLSRAVGAVATVGADSLTITDEGWYDVAASVSWPNNGTGSRVVDVTVNNADMTFPLGLRQAASATTRQSLAGKRYFAAGNVVRLRVLQDSGSALVATSTLAVTFASRAEAPA